MFMLISRLLIIVCSSCAVPVKVDFDNISHGFLSLESQNNLPKSTACGAGEFQCPSQISGTPSCIKGCEKCDNVPHCTSAEDEVNCPCHAWINGHLLCDGNVDCPDLSDELGCNDCARDEIVCQKSTSSESECISLLSVCKGVPCIGHDTTLICMRLAPLQLGLQESSEHRTKGWLQSRVAQRWLPVCGDIGRRLEIKVKMMCDAVVGPRPGDDSVRLVALNSDYSGLWVILESSTHSDGEVQNIVSNSCNGNMVVMVECHQPVCQRVAHTTLEDSNSALSRIVGGSEATAHNWSFIVGIRKNGQHHCGGTLITDSWVLSAAHCFMKISDEHYVIEVGTSRSEGGFDPRVQRVVVSIVLRHDEFDAYTMANDIVLLRLQRPLQLNRWVRTACLPEYSSQTGIKKGALCLLAGWGMTTEEGILASTLQEVSIPILEESFCQQEFDYINTSKIVCAGDLKGGRDACQGDSGGPLMCMECDTRPQVQDCNSSHWFLSALVSYGRGCARRGMPGVYTNVQHFLDWINTTIGGIENGSLPLPNLTPKTSCNGLECKNINGSCLPLDYVCNNKVDCTDARDEHHCNASQDATSPLPSAVTPVTLPNVTCEINEFKCSFVPQCIPPSVLCDQAYNCRDGSDEIGCSCADYLFGFDSTRVCDSVPDCFDYSDEYCSFCDSQEFYCWKSLTCIPMHKRCNVDVDCKYGEDEINCILLVDSSSSVLTLDPSGHAASLQNGQILLYDNEAQAYSPICSYNIQYNVANSVCAFVGYGPHKSISYNNTLPRSYSVDKKLHRQERSSRKRIYQNDNRMTYETNVKDSNEDNKNEILHNAIKSLRNKRQACFPVYLECGKRMCGKISDLLFVSSPPYTSVTTVPWAVNVFHESQYLCSATLIHNHWALTSGNCVQHLSDSSKVYISTSSPRIVLTNNLRFLGANEIQVRVDRIVPVGSEVSMLRLESPISNNTRVNPVCLNEQYINVNYKECMISGWYKDYVSYTILLELDKERICPPGSICVKISNAFNSICLRGFSGLISCRLERSINSTWYAVGIWRFEHEACTQTGQHTKLSAKLISDIYRVIDSPNLPITPSISTPCHGHRCPIGKCVTQADLCDAKPTCADLSDEPATCTPLAKTCDMLNGGKDCVCPYQYFLCEEGVCLSPEFVCDGVSHCAAGEDEKHCSCAKSLLSINSSQICDGNIDCSDQTDEEECGCHKEQFRCYKSGHCILLAQHCNGIDDCPNAEDETNCFTLAKTVFAEENVLGIPFSNKRGFLLIRVMGTWFTYLYKMWPTDLSVQVCSRLGYNSSEVLTEGRTLNVTFISKAYQMHRFVLHAEDLRAARQNENQTVVHISCF